MLEVDRGVTEDRMGKRRWVRLRVPASTANLGAGFDALGMALGLYNEIELERTGSGMRLEIEGEGAERLQALGVQNLVARAVTATLTHLGSARRAPSAHSQPDPARVAVWAVVRRPSWGAPRPRRRWPGSR